MLRERITYEHELPFTIGFSNVIEEDHHYHKELEITLVLRGHADYKIFHQEYHLDRGDVLLTDTEDLHRLYNATDDILMLNMHVDLGFFSYKYPNIDYTIFTCENYVKNTKEKKQEFQNKMKLMKALLAKLMIAYDETPEDTEKLMSMISDFISELMEQFQGFFIEDKQFKSDLDAVPGINMERLYRIVKYLYMNYDKKITLQDIANLEHLSPSYISHIIKDTTGLSFQNLLNYIRVEYAEKHLIEGKYNLTQISEFCGFSSSEYFNCCFKTWHGITPIEYKKNIKRTERKYSRPISREDAFSMLAPYVDNIDSVKKIKHRSFEPSDDDIIQDITEKIQALDSEKLKEAHSFINFLNEKK